MVSPNSYKTIRSNSEGIYKEKGSKFISYAFPVSNEDEIKPILEELRKQHHNARHHCYAYTIGADQAVWRINDDGEPSGTGGRPILGQIKSFNLTNILIVVVRYFGGTLLGVSGLSNAYKSAAKDALIHAEIIDHSVQEYYEIVFPYSSMNDVMIIIKDENIMQSDQSIDLECRILINFRSSESDRILSRLSKIEGIKLKYITTE